MTASPGSPVVTRLHGGRAHVATPGGDEQLLRDLAELSSLLLTADLSASLQRVAELGVEHIPGCTQIGVSLLNHSRLETGMWMGEAVCEIDGTQ